MTWRSQLIHPGTAGMVPRACELCNIEYFKILETSISFKVLKKKIKTKTKKAFAKDRTMVNDSKALC